MVNFAFILPLIVSSYAFAAPTQRNDLQQGTDSVGPVAPALPTVPVTDFQESGAAQPSSETTDVTDAPLSPFETLPALVHSLISKKLGPRGRLILANINENFRLNMLTPQDKEELMAKFKPNKEFSLLRQFQIYNNEARFAHLVESYLVERYRADPTEIRPIVRNLEDLDFSDTFELDLFKECGKDLSTLLSNGDEKQASKEQIEQNIDTVRGRLLVEVMNKVQGRINDEEMDELLSRDFQELTGSEIDWDTIHEIRAECSLDEGDKTLVEYMEENLKMDPVVTQNVINNRREEMFFLDWEGIAHNLFYHRDSDAMDEQMKKLVAEKEIENAAAIEGAIRKARNQIKSEEKKIWMQMRWQPTMTI